MDEKFTVKLRRETLVRPQIFQRLHPYVERITGLRMADLRQAPAFPDAFEEFFSFAFGKRALFCTWGSDDMRELYRNILYYGLNHKRLTRRFLDVQKMFGSCAAGSGIARFTTIAADGSHGVPQVRQVGLKTAVNAIGLPTDMPFHSALSDAQYTSGILRHVMNDDNVDAKKQIQTLNIGDLKDTIESKVHGINIKLLHKHAEHLLNRKLSERDKDAFLEIYKLGGLGKFDTLKTASAPARKVIN